MTTTAHDDRLDEFIKLLAKSRLTPSPMMFALTTAVLIGGHGRELLRAFVI